MAASRKIPELESAVAKFESISDYKDSAQQITQLKEKIQNIAAEHEAQKQRELKHRKLRNKILLISAAVILVGTLMTLLVLHIRYHKCGEHLSWKISGNTMTISGKGPMYSDWLLDYEKRQTVDTIIVEDGCTGIDSLDGFWMLTSVSLPESVTVIDDATFQGCEYLTQIELPSGLKEIGRCAFEGTGLTSLHIPTSVEIIEGLGEIHSLSEITVDENNPYFTTIDGVLYDRDLTTLVGYPDGKPNDSFEVPDGVTSILAESGLWDSENLTSITLPQSLSEGDYEYNYCNEDCVIHYLGTLEQWRENPYRDYILRPVVCSDGTYTYEEMMFGTWSTRYISNTITLTLREDMTCSYNEYQGVSGEGTWYVTDDDVRIQTSAYPFELYIDLGTLSRSLSTADCSLDADSDDWENEHLYRSNE